MSDSPEKLTARALSVTVAVAIAISGCGGGGNGGSASTEAPDELRIGFGARIITLDPDQALDPSSLAVLRLIGGTLYELDQDSEPFPVLIESAKTAPDELSWEFELKPDLKFSDQSPLTAEDVEATFARAREDKANAYAGFLAPIDAIEASSPTTVTFELNRPYPSLPDVLSQPEMSILPSEGLEQGKGFYSAPISAGPYELDSWGGGPTARVVRNPNYAGPEPVVEAITFETVEDANARVAQVRSGQLDLAHDVPPKLAEGVQAPLVATTTPIFGFISIPLNNDRPPFDDVAVRKAIALAIDREQINESVWNGGAVPLSGFWPSTMDGYDETIPAEPQLDEARALLEGTECEQGCQVTLMYSAEDSWAEGTALVVDQNLDEIGIDVELDKSDNAGTLDALLSQTYDMELTFLYDYSNMPDGMLDFGFGPSLNSNFSGFKPPPEVNETIQRAVTSSGAERDDALAEINQQFLDHQPYVTLETLTFTSVSRYDDAVVELDPSGFIAIGREGGGTGG